MKLLSFITLTALLSLASCSHFHKSACCKDKDHCSKEAKKCDDKEKCHKDEKCEKDKKCTDGHCDKSKTEAESCHKKTK